MNPRETLDTAESRLREVCESLGEFHYGQGSVSKATVSLTSRGETDKGDGDTLLLAMIDLIRNYAFGSAAPSVRSHESEGDDLHDAERQLRRICEIFAGDDEFFCSSTQPMGGAEWRAEVEHYEGKWAVVAKGQTSLLAMIEFVAQYVA